MSAQQSRPDAIRVLASVIRKDGMFLLCQRPEHKRHGGLWEFPGGKVESGESDLEAADRELTEELGVRALVVGQVEFSISDPGSPFVIEFLDTQIDGEPQCIEHASHAWAPLHELPRYELAPSDRRYVEFLLSQPRRTDAP